MLLVLATLVIVGFNVWRGHSKGFVHIVLSLCSTLLAILLAAFLTGPINNYIADNTGIYSAIEKQTDKILSLEKGDDKQALDTSINSDETAFKNSVKQVMDKFNVPEEIQDSVLNISIGDMAKDGVKTVKDMVIKAVTKYVGSAIIFVLLFFIMKVALAIVIKAMDLINKLPLIGDINQFAGMIVGAAYGIVIVWVALIVIEMFANMEWAHTLLSGINGNPVAEFIYNSNVIRSLISK